MQGLLFAGPECAKNQSEILRLWVHEAERVYKDKLVDNDDIVLLDKLIREIIKKNYDVRKATVGCSGFPPPAPPRFFLLIFLNPKT